VNAAGLLLIVIAFGFLWLVVMRPQRRRRQEQQQMLENLHVGDDVLTAGGIYGEITAVDEDEVMLEIAPRLEVRVARRAIAGIVTSEQEPPEPEAEPDEEPEAESGDESPAEEGDG
jgi:preprotein translocase subunit YajC